MFSHLREPSERNMVAPRQGTAAVAVTRLPLCDFCLDHAEYNGRTTHGRRANMCSRHLRAKGGASYERLVLARR